MNNYIRRDIASTTIMDKIELSVDAALYSAHYMVPISEIHNFKNDDHLKSFIKEQISLQLAKTLLLNSLVDFTYTKNIDDTITVRAKAYIAKQKDIRLLVTTLRQSGWEV